MLKGWWTYAVVLIAMLGALSACNSGDGDDDVVEARRYDFVTYLGYADGLARWQYIGPEDAEPIDMVAAMDEPPLRLLVGADAVEFGAAGAARRATEDARWRDLGLSVADQEVDLTGLDPSSTPVVP